LFPRRRKGNDIQAVQDCPSMSRICPPNKGASTARLRFATRHSRSLDSLSESAYGMYLVHYVFVVWLQYLLLGRGPFCQGLARVWP
jgi:hypothetical protein